MKNIIFFTLGMLLLFTSCNSKKENGIAKNTSDPLKDEVEVSITQTPRTLPDAFADYWYAGTAEISSYHLSQSRYGEMREGKAVTIFVTEDFNPEQQVKADNHVDRNVPMLKLNLTKKFNTGVYPYSIMTSTFNPLNDTGHALKVTNSVQEWCGQTYVQLNNKEAYEIKAHSYFQSEGDQEFLLEKTWLEDELWNIVRLNPSELPTGAFKAIPAFETVRLAHKEIKGYHAIGSTNSNNMNMIYTITYPELNKVLEITFKTDFPHTIERWEETHANGQVTKATLIKRIKSPYWSKNSEKFSEMRAVLGL